jgi:hypothetical protein
VAPLSSAAALRELIFLCGVMAVDAGVIRMAGVVEGHAEVPFAPSFDGIDDQTVFGRFGFRGFAKHRGGAQDEAEQAESEYLFHIFPLWF